MKKTTEQVVTAYNFTQNEVEWALRRFLTAKGVQVPDGELEILGLIGEPYRSKESIITVRVTQPAS